MLLLLKFSSLLDSWCCARTVCIKAGDLTLALEVFEDMKRKNCTPNLVTYNILIDVTSCRRSVPVVRVLI